MIRVRLTFEARQRFPDIATEHGDTARTTAAWISVTWDGRDGIVSWHPASDVTAIAEDPPA